MGCNCNEEQTPCGQKPCVPIKDCSCPIKDLSTDCVLYTGDDLECSRIKKGTILTDLIQQLDAFICDVKAELIRMFTIVNIGSGARWFKGVDALARKVFRTAVSTSPIITIAESTDGNEVEFGIDETELTDFVQTNQKTYSVDNVGTDPLRVNVYRDSTEEGDNTQFNFRSLITEGELLTSTENTDDVTLTIDETKLSQFVKDNQNNFLFTGENVGTGEGVYKETTGLVHKFKKLKAENVGTGTFSLLKPITATPNEVTISAKTIKTNNLDITEESDGTITIDTPVSTSNLSFYVDINSVADTETGSLSSPFKTLNKALDAFIGTAGTWFNPQYNGYKITLLSDCSLLDVAGVGYNGYTNLDVNNLQIEGNGFYLTLASNPSTDYYPISTRRMVTNMPKTAGVMDYSINMVFNNVTFQRTGTNAIVDNLHYSFPTADINVSTFPPLQAGVFMTFTNCTFINGTSIDSNPNFTTIPNPNDSGNPLLFFGEPVKASASEPWGVPMLKTEGRNWSKEGYLRLADCAFLGLKGGALYFKETSYEDYGNFNTFRLHGHSRFYESEVDDFYSPRLGTYLIELEDVNHFTLSNSAYSRTIPRMVTTENVPRDRQIGGFEAIIKLTNSIFYLRKGISEEGVENFCQLDGNSSIEIREFNDMNVNCNDSHGFFRVITPLPISPKTVHIENSKIDEVIVDETGVDKSYIGGVSGFNNEINNSPHNTYRQYPNDIAAKAAGLIKGNTYYNTAIGGLTSVF